MLPQLLDIFQKFCLFLLQDQQLLLLKRQQLMKKVAPLKPPQLQHRVQAQVQVRNHNYNFFVFVLILYQKRTKTFKMPLNVFYHQIHISNTQNIKNVFLIVAFNNSFELFKLDYLKKTYQIGPKANGIVIDYHHVLLVVYAKGPTPMYMYVKKLSLRMSQASSLLLYSPFIRNKGESHL